MSLNDLPDISFVETNPEKVIADIIKDYEDAYFESTGRRSILQPADPIRIFLYTQALREIQLRHLIDETAKQNLLKYARGNKLDHIGAISETSRGSSKAAETRMFLQFSQARSTLTIIPKGVRFTPETNIYFETVDSYELPVGEMELIVNVRCTDVGDVGNGFLPGQVNTIVDPQPFLIQAENMDVTQGGANVESDDSYRERIHLAPEGLSVAGPTGAYEYFTLQYSSLIENVKVLSPSPGTVDIRVLLKNGEMPNQSFLDGLLKHLSADDKRPLTDNLLVNAPNPITYEINLTYYIKKEDAAKEDLIKEKINRALNDYALWQRSKIGRDINPSYLSMLLVDAGAKRVEIQSPVFMKIERDEIAIVENIASEYGGLEDE